MTDYRLVFDLDDTLYPEREFAISGFRAAAAWAHETHGLTGLAEEMLALLDAGHLGQLFSVVLERRLGPAAQPALAPLIAAYRDHTPDIALFDDARWLLAQLQGRGPLGLITDGTHEVQASKVAALAITDHFEALVYTHALGGRAFSKPHPASYEQVEAQLGGNGRRMVYIGDNPSKDFVTPNARGWITIQVARSPQDARGHRRIHAAAETAEGGAAHHVVGSLHEVPALLGL